MNWRKHPKVKPVIVTVERNHSTTSTINNNNYYYHYKYTAEDVDKWTEHDMTHFTVILVKCSNVGMRPNY